MSKSDSKEKQRHRIEIAGKRYLNITVINKEHDEPVAIITTDELITKKGYQILFDVGEDI